MTGHQKPTEQATARYMDLIVPLEDGNGGIRLEAGNNLTIGINADGSVDLVVLEVQPTDRFPTSKPVEPLRNLNPVPDYSLIYDGLPNTDETSGNE